VKRIVWRSGAHQPAIPTATAPDLSAPDQSVPAEPVPAEPVPAEPVPAESSGSADAPHPTDPAAPSLARRPALLEVSELRFGHATVPLSGPVSLALERGTAVVVIGENGAGKSTLLRSLAGQLPTISGSVQFCGRPIDEREPVFRRAVASVFDEDAFFAELTVREHLVMVATAHSGQRSQIEPGPRRYSDPRLVAERELAAFGLEAVADSVPLALSSGQRRRLLLAAVFVRPAELVVLDEPEQRLDTGMRGRLIARLIAQRDRGCSVLAASHDRAVVADLADLVILVDEGGVRLLTPAAGLRELDSL
jgi:ABC-2 type transport system ATP-binding protein